MNQRNEDLKRLNSDFSIEMSVLSNENARVGVSADGWEGRGGQN